jgi:DNA-binding PadR family transcriptional regulator
MKEERIRNEGRTKKYYSLSEEIVKVGYRKRIRISNIEQRILKSEWNIKKCLPDTGNNYEIGF